SHERVELQRLFAAAHRADGAGFPRALSAERERQNDRQRRPPRRGAGRHPRVEPESGGSKKRIETEGNGDHGDESPADGFGRNHLKPQRKGEMNMKTTRVIALVLLALSTLDSQLSTLHAQGTEFTYSGRLTDNGLHFTGVVELDPTLWDAATNGNQIDIF